MKKKLLILCTILALTVCSVLFCISASAATYSGSCGGYLTYRLNPSTGVLTISGTGEMWDYNFHVNSDKIHYSSAPWGEISIREEVKTVVIGDDVTSIGDYAFYRCDNLTNVTFGNKIASIGTSAFTSCAALEGINVPDSNATYCSIDGVVFSKDMKTLVIYPTCGNSNYSIPNSVTAIGTYAFENCKKLTEITIPNSVTSIGGGAFHNCSSLASVTIPNSVTSIEISAFKDCGALSSVTIPDSVTSIGYYVFRNCSSLTSITIPDSVTSIGSFVFDGCSSLENLYVAPGSYTEEWAASKGYTSIVKYLLSFAEETINIGIGQEYSLKPNIPEAYTGDMTITWTSSDEAIASVEDGNIKALAVGNAVIKATLPGGHYAECNVSTFVDIPETADAFLKFEGYQVRENGYNGLRSKFVVDFKKMPTINENGYTVLEYGTILASTATLESKGDDFTVSKGEDGSYGTLSYAKLFPIYREYQYVGKYVSFDENELVYYCTVTNFGVKTFDKEVSIRGYAVIADAYGNEYVVYADYQNEEYRSVSLMQICLEMEAAGALDPLNCISYLHVKQYMDECGKYGDHEIEEGDFFD